MYFRTVATALAMLVGMSATAFALEPDAVFARYNEYLSRMGLTATHGGIVVESPSAIKFTSIDIASGTAEKPVRLEWLRISDFNVDDQGAFFAGMVEAGPANGESTDKDGKKGVFRIDGMKATGVFIPPSETPGAPSVSKTTPFTLDVGPISATIDGTRAVSINGIKAFARYAADGATIESETDFGRLDINTEPLPPDARAQLEALGLPTLSFTSKGTASWNPASGLLDVSAYRIEAPGAGALSLAFSLEGYTSQLAGQMQALAQKGNLAADASPEAQMALAGEQMALMGALKISKLKVTFEDASLTAKLLPRQAEAMGMTPDEMIKSVPAMIEPYLAMTGDPVFSAQASVALQAFLKTPGNLTVAISPSAPIAITELVGTALGDPTRLISLLGATVTANE